jgi:NADPH-dependent curcumin reductase
MVTLIAVASASKFGKPEIGERLLSSLLVTRLRAHGFLVSDWWHRRDEALRRLADWQRAGKLRIKQDILEGIESMPAAFLRLLKGENFGKQLVKVL